MPTVSIRLRTMLSSVLRNFLNISTGVTPSCSFRRFSVGRTQQIIYYLNRLAGKGRVPKDIKVYIDSPLSQKATRRYADHREVYNEEAKRMLAEGKDPLTFPGMTFIGTPEESMALNDAPGPMIIIAFRTSFWGQTPCCVGPSPKKCAENSLLFRYY